MKKIVSLALFGEKYSHFLPSFVRAHLNIFRQDRDWTLRIHYDDIVGAGPYGSFLTRAFERGLLQMEYMGSAPLSKASLWRMVPVFDSDADYVFCRDIDAIPMPRDWACCEEFMLSGAVVHTIHDNTHHVNIMAGLCGFDAAKFRAATKLNSLDELYAAAGRTDEEWLDKETDQHVLNKLLLVAGGPELFEHRYNGWLSGPDKLEAKPQGTYPCSWRSVPTTDYGSPEDYLGAHLGCAGYDYEAATKYWDASGDPQIAAKIKECES